MDSGIRDLLDRLSSGPAFLLLGQAFGANGAGDDDLLRDAFRLAGLGDLPGSLETLGPLSESDRQRFFETLGDMSRKTPPPEWLATVARFPWNGVLTTAIDSRVSTAFDAEWRRVVPSTGSEPRLKNPRSTTELNLRFLFGGASLAPDQQPPMDPFEHVVRESQAVDAIGALPNGLLTPRGLLAIEGYRAGDWLSPSNLFAMVVQLLPGQVHLFSAEAETISNPFIASAVQRGVIVVHSRSLSAVLDEAAASGRLVRPASVVSPEARLVRLGGLRVELGRDLWNDIISTARPIDDEILAPSSPTSAAIKYQQFRTFLGSSEGAPPWEAIAGGFSLKRDFEEKLWKIVSKDARERNMPNPLVVSGQSGSGKSVALSSLAVRLAREGEFAVLHASRRGDRPQVAAIDRYALWAEEQGASATVLLWDGMTDADEYYSVDRQLRARGRRVLIVGSTYLSRRAPKRGIVASSRLSETEAAQIPEWLKSYGVQVNPGDLATVLSAGSFLAALFRLLPETRRGLQHGLTLELRTVEREMEVYARQHRGAADDNLGMMAAALKRAGIDLPVFESVERIAELASVAFGERTTAEQLTAMVLVAGRRNLQVPLDLILRVIGSEGSSVVVDTVKQYDIIRWSEDESGDQYLGARTALEAELLAQSDLRDVRGEIPAIKALVSHVSARPGIGGPEVQFAVDLLARVGPSSEEGGRFRPYYMELVEALKELRETPGNAHPRLMLTEANLTRKYVMWLQGKSDESIGVELRVSALRDAEVVLEQGLELVSAAGRARLNLLVELSAVLGAQAYELSATSSHGGEVSRLANRVLVCSLEARAIDPENYHPVDVVAWVTFDLVARSNLSDTERTRLIADSIASLSSIDESTLTPQQSSKFHHRQEQFASLQGDDALADEHLARLAELDDPAAYFLLALRDSGLLAGDFDALGAKRALARLQGAPTQVLEDWRCSGLMLDLFWLTRTGQRFMQGEREALAFGKADWESALDLIDQVGGAATFDRYRIDFLRGLAHFHLGSMRQALSVFDQLDRDSAGMSRRVIATYVASEADGSPSVFTGQVRSITPDARRGTVWVDQIGLELSFIPYRFSSEPQSRGDALPEFYIAFNMRGPYADPVRMAKPRNARSSS